jgi:hypothetical protein
MRHAYSLVATTVVAALVAHPVAAQAPTAQSSGAQGPTPTVSVAVVRKALPPIPAARQFQHWGQVEQSYDDDENSSSISLSLSFSDSQRDAFARPGRGVDAVELQIGYVFAGRIMMTPPEVATLVIKLTRSTESALAFDKQTLGDMQLVIDGTEPLVFSAPLVQRNAVKVERGRVRAVQDTYAIVCTLPQYLRIVNGQKVTARMGDQIFDFTGGPLEGMREVASRIVITP